MTRPLRLLTSGFLLALAGALLLTSCATSGQAYGPAECRALGGISVPMTTYRSVRGPWWTADNVCCLEAGR